MKVTLLLFLATSFIENESKIVLNISSADSIHYSGEESEPITENLQRFFPNQDLRKGLYHIVENHGYNVLYKTFKPDGTRAWAMETILTVKYVKVKRFNKRPVVVLTQELENPSNFTIKANAAISHTVQNTVSTTWSMNNGNALSYEVEYDVCILKGRTTASYTLSWGKEDAISKSVTIGSTSSVEITLKPGESATAELSVTTADIEIEIGYKKYFTGILVVEYYCSYVFCLYGQMDRLRSVPIQDLLKETIIVETIKLQYNVDGKLRVSNKGRNYSKK